MEERVGWRTGLRVSSASDKCGGPMKHQHICIELHGFTSQNTITFVFSMIDSLKSQSFLMLTYSSFTIIFPQFVQ